MIMLIFFVVLVFLIKINMRPTLDNKKKKRSLFTTNTKRKTDFLNCMPHRLD